MPSPCSASAPGWPPRGKPTRPLTTSTQAGAELAAAGVLSDPQSFIAEVRFHIHEEGHNEADATV